MSVREWVVPTALGPVRLAIAGTGIGSLDGVLTFGDLLSDGERRVITEAVQVTAQRMADRLRALDQPMPPERVLYDSVDDDIDVRLVTDQGPNPPHAVDHVVADILGMGRRGGFLSVGGVSYPLHQLASKWRTRATSEREWLEMREPRPATVVVPDRWLGRSHYACVVLAQQRDRVTGHAVLYLVAPPPGVMVVDLPPSKRTHRARHADMGHPVWVRASAVHFASRTLDYEGHL